MEHNTQVILETLGTEEGDIITLQSSSREYPWYMDAEQICAIPVGSILHDANGIPCFLILGKALSSFENKLGGYTMPCKTLLKIEASQQAYTYRNSGYSIAWVTLSDKGSKGKRKDESGPLIGMLMQAEIPIAREQGFIIPDDPWRLEHLLIDLALFQKYSIIITTGGTGVSCRDITPDVMERVLHTPLPGFELAMMQTSMNYVSTAIISRARAGIIGQSVVVNLPGSPNAVEQILRPLIPSIRHAVDKICGDTMDCSGIFTI